MDMRHTLLLMLYGGNKRFNKDRSQNIPPHTTYLEKKHVLMHANKKRADQPEHPQSHHHFVIH